MKLFLKKVFTFLLSLFLIALIIQLGISAYIKNKNIADHDTWHQIKNQYNDVIFLGSSRCYSQFDPDYFFEKSHLKALNLGIDGHSELSAHRLRLNYYLAYNTPPKFVILNFDPFISPDADYRKQKSMYNKDCFARYAFLASGPNRWIADYYNFSPIERYVPLYALLKYRKLLNCFLSAKTTYQPFDKHNEDWDTTKYPVNKSEVLNFYVLTKYYNDVKLSLQRIKSICDQHNIKLICVQTPVYKDIYVAREFNNSKKICQELTIPFFDCNSDPLTADPLNFYNANHMNVRGGHKMLDLLFSDSAFVACLHSK
ncbi:MAG: hypothetical protein JST70_05305 [Bacteroidetes bacterium]|nr:hypothetical protein [Bacteroidota bacterium]